MDVFEEHVLLITTVKLVKDLTTIDRNMRIVHENQHGLKDRYDLLKGKIKHLERNQSELMHDIEQLKLELQMVKET